MTEETLVEDAFQEEDVVAQVRLTEPLRLIDDNARAIAYRLIAGLIDGGADPRRAFDFVSECYAKERRNELADSLAILRKALKPTVTGTGDLPSVDDYNAMKSGALEAFGDGLVSIEEVMVLSHLRTSANPAATLRAAAEVIEQRARHRRRF